ncbi:MAG: rRNA pseudouridine synthase [Pirellula sp.]|nr:rRNA pseudouridine synthase [Pirellula sp.]
MSNYHRGRSSVPSFLSGEQRINKLLAASGFGSRRHVDELITEGRVEIDGTVITQVGTKVDADKAKILVDGEPLKRHKPVYFAVHKPAGFLCTNADPEGRPRVIELVPSHARLFPVGRLDSSSTGLILLTNDGELSQRLAHPKHGVPKSYFVVVAGQVDKESLKRLQRGIYLAEGIARVDGATIRRVRKGCTEIDITLSEGKNREIRRVLARLGHKVVVLRRVSIASLKLGDLPEGSYRPLTEKEIAGLYKAVDELRSARNQDRRERKRRSDERRGEIRSAGTNAEEQQSLEQIKPNKPSKSYNAKDKNAQTFLPFDEESDDYEPMHLSDDDDDDFESLPSLSENPYRLADDEDDDDTGAADAILVKDSGWDDDFEYDSPKTTGAVLGADDEEPSSPRPPRRDGDRSRGGSGRPRSEGNRRTGGRPAGRSGSSNRPSASGRGRGDSRGDSRSRPEGRSRFQTSSSGEGQSQSERRPRPIGTRGRSDDSSSSEGRGAPRAGGRPAYRGGAGRSGAGRGGPGSRTTPRTEDRRSSSESGDRGRTDSRSRGFSNSELGGDAGSGRPGGNYRGGARSGSRGGGARGGRSFGGSSSGGSSGGSSYGGGRRSAPRSTDRSGRGPKNAKRGPRPKR